MIRSQEPANSDQFIQFQRDIYESIIQCSFILIFSIFVAGGYIFFCNFCDIKYFNPNPLSDSMTLLRNLFFLLTTVLIIVVRRLNHTQEGLRQSRHSRNTIVLYFMIAPLMTMYSLNCFLDASINIRLTNCTGYKFSFLEFFEGITIVFILLMLNDIDKMMNFNGSWSKRIWNRSIRSLIFVVCAGTFYFYLNVRIVETWGMLMDHYYNVTKFIPLSCLKTIKQNITFYNSYVKYKRFTAFATTSYTICVMIFSLSYFNWFFIRQNATLSPRKMVSHRQYVSQDTRVIPTIIIMVLLSFIILPIPFVKNTDNEMGNIKYFITGTTVFFKISGSLLIIILSIVMIREARTWNKINPQSSSYVMHQLFSWAGLLGHGFIFISEMRYRIYKRNIIEEVIAVLQIISIIFQTFLVDIFSKKQIERPPLFSWIEKIQPVFLLSGINIGWIFNDVVELFTYEKDHINMNIDVMTHVISDFSSDLKHLQRVHASLYFMKKFTVQ